MATLKIINKEKELEIYEKSRTGIITIDIARINKDDYDYLSMDLSTQQIKLIIQFLQKQINE